jgi:hypothetical protein
MAALGQLIAGVAYEVNTPISAVKARVGNMVRMLPEPFDLLHMLVPQTLSCCVHRISTSVFTCKSNY